MQSTLSLGRGNSIGSHAEEQVFTSVAMYKDRLVAVKRVTKQTIPLTRPNLIHLKKVRNPFDLIPCR